MRASFRRYGTVQLPKTDVHVASRTTSGMYLQWTYSARFFLGTDFPARLANTTMAPTKTSRKGANRTPILTGNPIERSRKGGAKYPKYASSIPLTRHKTPKPNMGMSILDNLPSTQASENADFRK